MLSIKFLAKKQNNYVYAGESEIKGGIIKLRPLKQTVA